MSDWGFPGFIILKQVQVFENRSWTQFWQLGDCYDPSVVFPSQTRKAPRTQLTPAINTVTSCALWICPGIFLNINHLKRSSVSPWQQCEPVQPAAGLWLLMVFSARDSGWWPTSVWRSVPLYIHQACWLVKPWRSPDNYAVYHAPVISRGKRLLEYDHDHCMDLMPRSSARFKKAPSHWPWGATHAADNMLYAFRSIHLSTNWIAEKNKIAVKPVVKLKRVRQTNSKT